MPFVPATGKRQRSRLARAAPRVSTTPALRQHRHRKLWKWSGISREQQSRLDPTRNTPHLTRSYLDTCNACTAIVRAQSAYTAWMSDSTSCKTTLVDTCGCTSITSARKSSLTTERARTLRSEKIHKLKLEHYGQQIIQICSCQI